MYEIRNRFQYAEYSCGYHANVAKEEDVEQPGKSKHGRDLTG